MYQETNRDAFFINGIATVSISEWLNWASGELNTGNGWPIVLPMIQRGSVWKPHQVMDLWDTLLRGMPLGSMMASRVEKGGQYFTPINRKLQELPEKGGLSLLDGQQRTLSMLLAWPAVGDSMNRKIWVDLGEDDKTDHNFRFHFTTKSHPFGFQLAGRSGTSIGKLSLSERRQALAAYSDLLVGIDKKSGAVRQDMLWSSKEVLPWHGTLPVNLQEVFGLLLQEEIAFEAKLIGLRLNHMAAIEKRIQSIQAQEPGEKMREVLLARYQKQFETLNNLSEEALKNRIRRLRGALIQFKHQYMPVIEVPSTVFSAESDTEGKDPALAVLFQRVGTGGTALSNADYVYSVIKHHSPECHSMVENLLKAPPIEALFTPVSLVTTAVRLTAAKLHLSDYAQINKNEFAGLIKRKNGSQTTVFLAEFGAMISEEGAFTRKLNVFLDSIAYQANQKNDIGLPKHALCLIELPILEVILCWLQDQDDDAAQTNRARLIRFVLYCALAVTDIPKSSAVLFKKMKDFPSKGVFPDKEFIDELIKQNLAYPMRSPAFFENNPFLKWMIETPAKVTSGIDSGLRGWPRFAQAERTEKEMRAIELYRRFWNRNNRYTHTLLLWLQREYVHAEFETIPALPGSEDETPYDFDHICPQNHWAYWTGTHNEEGTRIIDFCGLPNNKEDKNANKSAESLLGNSIGNVRVWSSSDNRSDGDAPPAIKLKLKHNDAITEVDREEKLLRDCAISENEIGDWLPWHYLKPFPPVIGGCCRGPQGEAGLATDGFLVVA